MKKIIAIIFLSILCLATISGEAHVWESGYELISDSESADIETKEGKKDIIEYVENSNKNLYPAPGFMSLHKIHKDLIYQQHLPGKPAPPPDTAC